ncbi:MAG: hypothetical protein K8S99_17800 [Planctomycetes bacterium]|nr:hypothetical protein [Planctomycetota bacterium]
MTVLGPRLYLLQLTRGIKDPVEKMLVQEFTVAHHRLMQLHTQASAAHGLEAVKVYNSAVARLQGELRRVALTIKAYRQPPAQKSFAVITQQNVVSGGDQHVQYVDMGQGKESLVARDELKGKTDNPLENRINGTFPGTGEEPAACGGGTAERQQAAPLVG